MSAAEKLRGLGEPWWSDYDTDRIISALSQIVAVVEAAENQRRDAYGMPLTDKTMDAALAALDEALQ